MKIAVTGADGFVGKYVTAELEKRSLSRVLVTRHAAERIVPDSKTAALSFDLRTPPDDAFELMGRPDALIHLAWGGLPHYRSLHHFEQELPVHYRFLKGLIEAGLKNLIVTGTCLEYGMQFGQLSEDLETRPIVPYAFAKDCLRRQLQYLQQALPFNLTWARLFYLFGEGQAPTSLLPLLRSAVERGEKVFGMSGGKQLRDYLSVEQAAQYLVCLATEPADRGIVNVCSGKPISIRELVEGWIRQNNWSIELGLGHHPYPDYEPMEFWGDDRKVASYRR